MSSPLDRIEVINVNSKGSKNVTKEYRLYGLIHLGYSLAKKDRPDLCPQPNTWVCGIAGSDKAALFIMTELLYQLGKADGMTITKADIGPLLASMIKEKMIEVLTVSNSVKQHAIAIKLLKGTKGG